MGRFDLAAYLAERAHRRTGVATEWILACPRCGGHEHLYVNVEKRCGHCFRCDWSPGLVELVAELEGLAPADVRQRLGTEGDREARPGLDDLRARIVGPEEPADSEPASHELAWPREYVPLAEKHDVTFEKLLAPFRAYLARRGIAEVSIARHRVGCALLGRYAGRVIFPVLRDDRLVALQARDITGRSPAKYIGPPGSRLGEHLFNYDDARRFSRIILCEGIISALHAGDDAVASFGKTLKPGQLALLVQAARPVVVLFDAAKDSGAVAAEAEAIRAASTLHESGVPAFIARLPRGDPADTPPDVVRAVVEAAEAYDPLRRLRRRLG